MSSNQLPKRKPNRLDGFDYSSCTTYFITIYTKDKRKVFGKGAPTIPNMANQLKGYVTKRIGFSVWQKLYYDHIIRDEDDYNTKWEYIENNPAVWFDKNEI